MGCGSVRSPSPAGHNARPARQEELPWGREAIGKAVYASRAVDEVSWFQHYAGWSLRLIQATGVALSASVIDFGGGASRLVDALLNAGYSALTVLDISTSALAAARKRLGSGASKVRWLQADITTTSFPLYAYDVWHRSG